MIRELTTSYSFTPEQLFGEVPTSGLIRYTAFLEHAKADAERDSAGARVALSAYLVVRLIDAYLSFSESRASDPEGLRWQLRAVRRHIAELPQDDPHANHLAGLIEAIPDDVQDRHSCAPLRVSLTAYAYFLEHNTQLEEALEVLGLASRTHGGQIEAAEFAVYALSAGRVNRFLARWQTALTCYVSAENAAKSVGDIAVVLRAQLGRAAVCRGQGNLPKARQIAEAAAREADISHLAELQAFAYAELGLILGALGLRAEGLRANYQAFLLTPDSVHRMRTLGDLGIDLLEIGAYDAARLAFEIVINSKTNHVLRTNALLELMDLESTIGNRVAFERCRVQAEVDRSRMPPSMATDYLYKVGIGLARFGQLGRAQDALKTAINLAETHGLHAWYFKIEQALKGLDIDRKESQTVHMAGDAGMGPVIQEMETGLREYAALQPA